MFLSYEEYMALGGKLDEAAFNIYGYEAEQRVSSETHKRIYNVCEETKERVKACIARVADMTNKGSVMSSDIKVTASSHDGLSQSYSLPTQSDYSLQISDIIYNYLCGEKDLKGVPLLYRGCDA